MPDPPVPVVPALEKVARLRREIHDWPTVWAEDAAFLLAELDAAHQRIAELDATTQAMGQIALRKDEELRGPVDGQRVDDRDWFERQASRTAEDLKKLPDWLRTQPVRDTLPDITLRAAGKLREARRKRTLLKLDTDNWDEVIVHQACIEATAIVEAERATLQQELAALNTPERWMKWCDSHVLERAEAAEAALARVQVWAVDFKHQINNHLDRLNQTTLQEWVDDLAQALKGDPAEAERDTLRQDREKWLKAFNESEQFQSGPTTRAEAAEAALARVQALQIKLHDQALEIDSAPDVGMLDSDTLLECASRLARALTGDPT